MAADDRSLPVPVLTRDLLRRPIVQSTDNFLAKSGSMAELLWFDEFSRHSFLGGGWFCSRFSQRSVDRTRPHHHSLFTDVIDNKGDSKMTEIENW